MSEPNIQPWEQQENESPEAYEAWTTYLDMGPERNIRAVALKLGKSDTLVFRWSGPQMHGWQARLRAWNRHEARVVNERVVLGKAAQREKQIKIGSNLQVQALKKLTAMSPEEISKLSVNEMVALLKAGVEFETKARAVPQSELDASERYDVPAITVEFLEGKPDNMVPVRLADGTTGYIPALNVDAFKVEYPDAVVVI